VDRTPFDPPAILHALANRRVEYVLVGGLAVGLWAHPRATKDTDILVPTNDRDNDGRLGEALGELDASPLPLEAPGARALGIHWAPMEGVERFQTVAGTLDVLRDPDGAAPYPQLRARAQTMEAFGARAVVVGREDLIAMKLAASRLQDLIDLDALLDPANSEPERVALRAQDRKLLSGVDEPEELGDPVDPVEHLVDELRRRLTPTQARGEMERRLRARARELQELTDDQLHELALPAAVPVPEALARTAAQVAAAASGADAAEEHEFALVRERADLGRLARRDKRNVEDQLAQASAQVERLRSDAELGVERLRAGTAEIERFYNQHSPALTERIALLRERYRRHRAELAQRVLAAPASPASYITQTLGQRPSKPSQRALWDRAARAIEAYASRHEPPHARPPVGRDRETRAAWQRALRATHETGAKLGPADPTQPAKLSPPSRRGPRLGR